MQKISLIILILLLSNITGCNTGKQKNSTVKQTVSKNIIVDTGQSTAYGSNGLALKTKEGGNFYGQDADYSNTPFKFEKSKDGVTVLDLNTGITWQGIPPEKKFSWNDATQYCADLNLAEHSDWRLPSLKELISIEDFREGWPYIDTTIFSLGKQPIGKQLQYWSSNFYHLGKINDGTEKAFGLNYGTGHIKGYPTDKGKNSKPPTDRPPGSPSDRRPQGVNSKDVTNKGSMPPPPPGGKNGRPPRGHPAHKLVRCVYGAPYGENQFIDNGNGTISDLATGLMWLKNDSGKGLDWEHALAYAEKLKFAGHSDWRLPNIKELQSIVDYSGVYPAINPKYFNITDKHAYFWSSTSAYYSKYGSEEQGKYYWAWYVAFGYAVGPNGKDSHGAGAVRYDSKAQNGPVGEDAERVFNYARAVRQLY